MELRVGAGNTGVAVGATVGFAVTTGVATGVITGVGVGVGVAGVAAGISKHETHVIAAGIKTFNIKSPWFW
jgi:hypothetical protein